MPTITLNKQEILKLSNLENKDDKFLKEKISMLGTDLESITDKEINVEIFPNRPDLLSSQGFARALSDFCEKTKGLKEYKIKKSDVVVMVNKNIEKIRPYTVCAVIKNLKLNDQKIKDLIQIQEKLHITFARNRKKMAIGIYPLDLIKTPIHFKAMDKKTKFQALEMDKELKAIKILQKHPKGRDYAHLLEGLDKYPFFIDSNDEIMSLPPVINSEKTGKVNKETKNLFIEVSGFSLEEQNKALNMIVTSIADMGGEIYTVEVKYPDKTIITPNLKAEEMKFDAKYAEKILGIKFSEKELTKYLGKMGISYKNGKALIPSYRADILHPIDLVEDLAIGYGYNNIKEIIPNVATTGRESNIEILKGHLREIMTNQSFIEVMNYNITNEKSQTTLINKEEKIIKIKNSLSSEFNVLRNNLLGSLMLTLKNNRMNEYPQKIFETGRIFLKDKQNWIENDALATIIANKDVSFTEIRQSLDYILKQLNVEFSYEKLEDDSFIPGRSAIVKVNNKKIGIVGELHPLVITNFEIEVPISFFEINLNKLLELI